jgi:hypothetical protein
MRTGDIGIFPETVPLILQGKIIFGKGRKGFLNLGQISTFHPDIF